MKTVLITGGSRGIGRAIVQRFAEAGYNVVLNYSKSEEAAYKLSEKFSNIKIFRADISNKKQVNEMIDFATKEFITIIIIEKLKEN